MNFFKAFALIITAIIGTFPAAAQTYTIPFASKGNTLQLEVVNSGQENGQDLLVQAVEIPDWISLSADELHLDNISSGDSQIITFRFDAGEKVEVGEVYALTFQITQQGRVIGEKNFQLASDAPADFKLFANFPNPFNPATTISYQLPEQTKVTVQIFNILGQLVSEPVNASQKPGKYQFRWNASSYASGVYLYRFVGKTESGKQVTEQRKMLLVK
ncbi:MAG: T9SS type A sorting domain-containing protein [Gracilimonas sp.]|uniref:T9SS type A sorting domain-containing protein n=1 Tax=Gracilimonas TaxID=649462 RepID=UPI001B1DA549|nr:T9SS type A sorting domain-containing protein [Gracilimonas sp.]MBO6586909.1 T9SS type A sorting domain-containing protein [Gracilimonas sp.]MBO6614603.1 T9SS type A sorting domain-containing protein [Gracilimonas sp.]